MKKRNTKTYPLEFKQSSAQLAAESDCSISETARSLGVNVTTLHGWVDKFYPATKTSQPPKEAVNEELKRLQLENARLQNFHKC